MKPPASKWFVAPGPERKNSHLNPTQGRLRHFIAGAIETGCLRAVLDVDLEVVLQVLADARQVVDDVDAERLELAGVADPGELEQLRRVDRAAAEDHLAGLDPLRPVLPATSTPTARVPSNSTRLTNARQRTSRFGRRMTGWRYARAALSRRPRWMLRSNGGEPLLPVPVHVVGERVARPAAPPRRTPRRAGSSAGPRSSTSGPSPPRNSSAPARQVSIRLKYGRQCA